MALDPRLYRAMSHSPDPYRNRHFNESTASAPSLRALVPFEDNARDSMAGPGGDAGNVKVVVRVRAFVKRGKKTCPKAVQPDQFS